MATQDTELIVVDIGGGGGGKEPPAGGDGGGDGDRGRRRRKPPQRRYSTAITLGMISILMFFLGLCVAFLVLKPAIDFSGFRKLWRATTILGFLFLAGQLLAWLQLVASGIYIASNQATSFFYIFTAAHAVHLLGGVAALLYVATRDFEKGKISRNTAVEIASYYWHFMDGLWVFLLLLLYLGK